MRLRNFRAAWNSSAVCRCRYLHFSFRPSELRQSAGLPSVGGPPFGQKIILGEAAIHNFGDPVHETLTQRIFGCDGDWSDCEYPDLEYAGPYVIAWVRWNDDPVFLLTPGKPQICRATRAILSAS